MYKLLPQCVVAAAQQELTSELESDTNTDENSRLSLLSASAIAKKKVPPQYPKHQSIQRRNELYIYGHRKLVRGVLFF